MMNSIVEYLKHVSKKYPDKIAYNDIQNKVTFSEIEYFSSNIASKILEFKLFNEPILVLSERNVFTPVTYLGIAMAGCFYIPIDSNLNADRVKQIIAVSNSRLLMINDSLSPFVADLDYKGTVLTIENALRTSIDEGALHEVGKKINCQMPLYVIFTSGSTGRPKGVVTSHMSLINYIEAVDEVLNLNENDVLGNQSPLDYIAAVRDIFLPLKTGATTIIIPRNEFAMPSDLARTLEWYKVSVLCWSAAGLEVALKSGLLEELRSKYIRKVLFSGSILPGKVLKQWQECFPDAQFINQYGPTEATASCTYYVVKQKADDSTVLPIGIPYKNYSILLLNEDGSESKEGEIGEICVSGLGVTLGYYGNIELTQKSYIQNPLNDMFREIIYKTGDLGLYNDAGELVFCGRKDRQIKHLGHRIELDEIELCAKNIEGINECVAVYDDARGVLFLIYSGSADKKRIILHFRESMPSFMVPRKVVQVEKIPHLPNGKIDVKTVKENVM